jgi:hypothetical protein
MDMLGTIKPHKNRAFMWCTSKISHDLLHQQPHYCVATALIGFFFFCLAGLSPLQIAQAVSSSEISMDWGGHIRAIGTLSDPDKQSVYQFTDHDTFMDSQAELRLNHQLFMGKKWAFETHYEMVGQQGDTLKNNNRLESLLPASTADRLLGNEAIDDDRRLLNLTRSIKDGDNYSVYHRLDRFNLTYSAHQGTLRIGRQALTWGNGLLFNPVDIFNPFAPTTIQRDYKVGDDMLHLQLPMGDSEVQMLYLPRRNPDSSDVSDDQSSLAGKFLFPFSSVEFDLMAARHFDDLILGMGASGYLGGAAWRWDMTYTQINNASHNDGHWQVVANIDYAWQWDGKNIYGLIEFYHNGLGYSKSYARALSDPAISQRVARGELFTLGQNYLAGQLRLEIHPLMLTNFTTIVNTADPSAILQPQIIWDVAANFQLILGAGFNWGDDNTEFGGFDFDTGTATIKVAPSNSRYLWLTYYF